MTDLAVLGIQVDSRSTREAADALDKLGQSGKEAGKDLSTVEAQAGKTSGALDSLGRSGKTTEQGLDLVEKQAEETSVALDVLGKETLEATRLQGELASTTSRAAAQAGGFSPVLGRLSGAFQANSFAIQNASYQLQDIVVQLSMGTDISRTLGMQLPQLASAFGGATGAIIGLGAGLGFTLLPMLLELIGSAEESEDALKDLQTALGDLESFSSTFSRNLRDNLVVVFDDSSTAVEGLIARIERLRMDSLSAAVSSASSSLLNESGVRESLAGLDDRIRARAPVGSGARSLELATGIEEASFARRFGSTVAQVRELQTILENIQGASAEELARSVAEAAAQAETLGDMGERVADILAQAADDTGLLESAMAGVDDVLSNSSSSAASLARQLNISVDAASRLLGVLRPAETILDPRDPRYDPIAAEMVRVREETQRGFSRTRPARVAGGGGSSDPFRGVATDAEIRNSIGRNQEQARMRERLQVQRDLIAANEEYNRGLEETDRLAISLDRSFSALFTDVLSGTKSMKEAFADFFSSLSGQFASMAAQQASSALFGDEGLDIAGMLLKSVLGAVAGPSIAVAPTSGGGIHSGINWSLIGGGFANGGVFSGGQVLPFASGGIVSSPTLFPMANGAGLMGEAGPEAIMPLQRGADGRLGVAASGGRAPRIVINNYSGESARARTLSNGDIEVIIGMARRAVAADVRADGNDISDALSSRGLSRSAFT